MLCERLRTVSTIRRTSPRINVPIAEPVTILDRYLLFLFLKIFLVCFTSFVGLFLVIHLFSNLDELTALAEPSGGWAQLLADFYGPRIAELFDKSAAILVLISAIFAVNMMQKRRELLAIEAGGITQLRAVRPIIVAALCIIGLTTFNREYVIPTLKHQLVRTPQNWLNTGKAEMLVQQDARTGIRFRGKEILLGESTIVEPKIQLPASLGTQISRLSAHTASFEGADETHPAGIRLQQVTQPVQPASFQSIVVDQTPVVYSPSDVSWLEEDELFVVSDVSMEQAAFGNRLALYRTTPEMMAAVRKPRTWFGNNQKVGLHVRVLQPFLDLTLLLLGLPLAMSNADRNIFVAAGVSFAVVAAVSIVTLASQSLGTYNLIQPAALSAWIPLIVFVPLAVLSVSRLR
jgi:lipopolysaccharide export system permease protein